MIAMRSHQIQVQSLAFQSGLQVNKKWSKKKQRIKLLQYQEQNQQQYLYGRKNNQYKIRGGVECNIFPFVEAWGPSLNNEALAPNIFAVSIFPYAAFLYFLTRSNQTPRLTLFGFYFLLVFVFVTIPAGIYAKVHYGTSLSNVDWLHGGAESFLTITNLLIVLGLRQGIREGGRSCNKLINHSRMIMILRVRSNIHRIFLEGHM
eukprot:TRINITY_DN2619_c0_g1_i7.p1 TRINITY_DN2619_c0_g1~~TRINITY_DN2619_c0_g1_i7.p1  ORF type:complete len:215 (-),score=14.41 TRINITY_DN2619_c0_g1_i7:214-825(-)